MFINKILKTLSYYNPILIFRKPILINAVFIGFALHSKQLYNLKFSTKGCISIYINDVKISNKASIQCSGYKTTSFIKVKLKGILFSNIFHIPINVAELKTDFKFLQAANKIIKPISFNYENTSTSLSPKFSDMIIAKSLRIKKEYNFNNRPLNRILSNPSIQNKLYQLSSIKANQL